MRLRCVTPGMSHAVRTGTRRLLPDTIARMSIHPIVVYGEPVLHRRAERVTEFDDELRTLVADMYETLAVSNGVGLAAPQIGVGKQIFVYDADDEDAHVRRRGVFINPVLVGSKVPEGRPDPETESEGCLSVPALDFPLKRSQKVTITGVDENGETVSLAVTGWFARIMQHEYDHLQGTLYVDRLQDKWKRRWKRAQKAEGYDVPGQSWMPGVDPDPFGHDLDTAED